MTLVLTFRFLTHIAVVADCRVSYEPGPSAVDDNLQKLYQLDKVVMGFSGPVQGASQVIQAVRGNAAARSGRRSPAAADLLRDIERWIRYEYRRLEPAHREHLSFLLASVEPGREARTRHGRRLADGTEVDIPKPAWFPSWPELSSVALRPSRSNPGELDRTEKGGCKIIGPSKEDCTAVQRVLMRSAGHLFRQPALQARLALDRLMLTLMGNGVVKAGGLLQCALLGSWGIDWLQYSSPGRSGGVALKLSDGRFVQQNHATGKKIPLLTVWEWVAWREDHPPGSAGAFEDPTLRQVVTGRRNEPTDGG